MNSNQLQVSQVSLRLLNIIPLIIGWGLMASGLPAYADEPIDHHDILKPAMNYQLIARISERAGYNSFAGPGSLLLRLKDSEVEQQALNCLKVRSPEEATRIAKERCFMKIAAALEPNHIIKVTDLRKWTKQNAETSYAWCVSKLKVNKNRPLSQPRVVNRVWIDAASGKFKLMRVAVRSATITERPMPPIIPQLDGNLLSHIAAHGDVISRLKNSKVPVPKMIRQWQQEVRDKWPYVNLEKYRSAFMAVYMLIELSGDCDFGRDRDLVWIVHSRGKAIYEFKGEQWVNCRTGKEKSFATEIWER